MDNLLLAIFIIVLLAQWFLIVSLVLRNREISKIPSLTLTEPQSLNILRRAYKKAQAILGQAELTSIKTIAESKLESQKLNTELTEETKKKLDEYLQTLTIEGKASVSKFLEEFQKNTVEGVQKSLEDYKTARMKALDDNISIVAQRAIEVILEKKMTKELQVDLIYEALEQAKQEKLIT